jgi:hypothetical protein
MRIPAIILLALLAPAASAQVPPPAYPPPPAGSYTPPNFSCTQDGAYTICYFGDNKQPITTPWNMTLDCTLAVNCPATVGFSLEWTGQAPIAFTAAGSDPNALAGIAAQFKGNAAVKTAFGADIVGYALVRVPMFQFFGSWPFCADPNLKAVDLGGFPLPASGNYFLGSPPCAAEVNPVIVFYRTLPAGMPWGGGSACPGIYFTADGPGGLADAKNVNPMLGQIICRFVANGGISLSFSGFDTIDLSAAHNTVASLPIVGAQTCRAFLSTSQAGIHAGQPYTPIDFDAASACPAGLLDVAHHQICPSSPGTYRVTAHLYVTGLATEAQVTINKNGAIFSYGAATGAGGSGEAIVLNNDTIPIAAGDCVGASGYAVGSGPFSFNAGPQFTSLTIERVGP